MAYQFYRTLAVCLLVVSLVTIDGNIQERLRRAELDFTNFRTNAMADIVDLFSKVEVLSAAVADFQSAGDPFSGRNLKQLVQSYEEKMNASEADLADMEEKMAAWEPPSQEKLSSFKTAFLEEKKIRKKLEHLVHRFSIGFDSLYNATLEALDDRLTSIEDLLVPLSDKISKNEEVLKKIDSNLTESFTEQIQRIKDTLRSNSSATLVNINTIISDLCKLSPPCSDWSEWSTCSAPCESRGTKSRTRTCPDESYAFCPSVEMSELEEQPCENRSTCCPDHYSKTESGFCFISYLIAKRSSDVKAYCEGQGDHLVSLTSEAKQTEFLAFAESIFGSGWTLLIDGRKTGSEWLDRHGTPLTYTNWRSGEPARTGECVTITTTTAHWATTRCEGHIFSFVCERGH